MPNLQALERINHAFSHFDIEATQLVNNIIASKYPQIPDLAKKAQDLVWHVNALKTHLPNLTKVVKSMPQVPEVAVVDVSKESAQAKLLDDM